MSKHRGKKRNNYISARDKIMHSLNELFVPGTRKIDAERYQIRSYRRLENDKAIANRFIDFCEKESIKTVSAMENMIPEYLLLKKRRVAQMPLIKHIARDCAGHLILHMKRYSVMLTCFPVVNLISRYGAKTLSVHGIITMKTA